MMPNMIVDEPRRLDDTTRKLRVPSLKVNLFISQGSAWPLFRVKGCHIMAATESMGDVSFEPRCAIEMFRILRTLSIYIFAFGRLSCLIWRLVIRLIAFNSS